MEHAAASFQADPPSRSNNLGCCLCTISKLNNARSGCRGSTTPAAVAEGHMLVWRWGRSMNETTGARTPSYERILRMPTIGKRRMDRCRFVLWGPANITSRKLNLILENRRRPTYAALLHLNLIQSWRFYRGFSKPPADDDHERKSWYR